MNKHLRCALTIMALLGAALPAARTASAQESFEFHYRYPQRTGRQIFQGVCQACHMPDAKGAVGAGAYPALAGDNRLAAASYPMTMVLNGYAAMPPFGDYLSSRQIAEVVNYIRTHFGNHYRDAVTAAAVHAMRSRTKSRPVHTSRPGRGRSRPAATRKRAIRRRLVSS